MAALLTYEMGSTEKVVEYIEECRRLTLPDGAKGIKVLPPDVNVSENDFTPVYIEPETPKGKKKAAAKGKQEGVIRFGLCAVRGVGEKAVQAVIDERKARGEFVSLFDFTERVDLRTVTRATIEALVKCGAFSSLKAKRAQLLQVLDAAVETGQQSQQDKRSGQLNIFASLSAPSSAPSASRAMSSSPLPDVDELADADLLKYEKELLGFYITSHPLTEHQVAVEHFSTASTKEAQALSEGTEVTIGGMINRVKKVITKNGRSAGMPMAIITLEDLEGQIDGTMFAETFAEICQKYPEAVKAESIVFVRGKVDRKRETPSLLINEVLPVAESVGRLTTAVALKLDPVRHTAEVVAQLEPLLKRHKGNTEVFLQVDVGGTKRVVMRLDRERSVRPTQQLVEDLEMLLGTGSVQLCGAGTRRKKRQEQQRQQPLFGEEAAEGETTDAAEADPGAALLEAEPAADDA
jgi:DNA polymerase-3 subunit alpha